MVNWSLQDQSAGSFGASEKSSVNEKIWHSVPPICHTGGDDKISRFRIRQSRLPRGSGLKKYELRSYLSAALIVSATMSLPTGPSRLPFEANSDSLRI